MKENTYIGTSEFDFISEEDDMFVDFISANGNAPYAVALGRTAVALGNTAAEI